MSFDTTNTTEVESPGDAIQRLVREKGRTKWSVARELGTHPSHLSKLISGERRITPGMAERLGEVFGVPVETFLPGGGE